MPNPTMPASFFDRLSGRESEQPEPPRKWVVYRLRKAGQLQAKEAMRNMAAIGLLRVWRNGRDELQAALRYEAGTNEVLPRLAQVQLLKIDQGGVLLAGIEREPAHDGREIVLTPFRQTWWCVPS